MATNNAINLKSSGIASYDGAGTFSALANPLTVTNGGLGATSYTAFSLLCGGTSTTNPVQSLSSLGSTGQVCMSNGSGSLPSYSNSYSGLTFNLSSNNGSPADATTYFLSTTTATTSFTATGRAQTRFYMPKAGTINVCYGQIACSAGTSEATTLALRLNNTTDTNVSTSLVLNTASVTFNNTALGISVAAGDYIEVKLICPTWATNPLSVRVGLTFVLS